MKTNLARRIAAETVGTAGLLATIVGSGIMAERLASGNIAVALLANTLATGAGLIALILTFGPISGAHFNPAVTIADALEGGIPWRENYRPDNRRVHRSRCSKRDVQAAGVFCLPKSQNGICTMVQRVHRHFWIARSHLGCSRRRSMVIVPFAVAAYITAAYWFTASTSFANPAVTLARSVSDTFAGIRPADAPEFILAQFAGAIAATLLFRWLVPVTPKEAESIVVPHN